MARAIHKEKHMAKRILLVSVLAALVAGGAFAQVKLSAGAGYIHSAGNLGATNQNYLGGSDINNTYKTTGNGGFLFLDATYAELSLGLMGGLFGYAYEIIVTNPTTQDIRSIDYDRSILSMDIGLLGRYPVPVGKMTISPLLGIGYNLVLGAKNLSRSKPEIDWDKKGEYADGPGDYSSFRIRFGAGADFDVTDRIFVRAQGLAHYSFAPAYVSNYADRYNEAKGLSAGDDGYASKAKGGGFGGEFTFAVGYRF